MTTIQNKNKHPSHPLHSFTPYGIYGIYPTHYSEKTHAALETASDKEKIHSRKYTLAIISSLIERKIKGKLGSFLKGSAT